MKPLSECWYNDDEMLMENAATASQDSSLIDDPITREAVKLNCIKPLKSHIAALESALAEAQKENAGLRDCCSMRGARMQILREYIPCTVWHQDVLYERPEVADWFDKDGVPK